MSGHYRHLWPRADGLETLSPDDLRIYLSNIVQQTALSERVRIVQAMIDDSTDQVDIIRLESTLDHLMDLLNELMERRWNFLLSVGLSNLY